MIWKINPMKNRKWLELRSRLHHDWLQNSYITFLNARADHLEGSLRRSEKVRLDVKEQFAEWKEKEGEFRLFFQTAVDALSPAQLLDEPPLCQMTHENRTWLKELVHALFVVNSQIEKRAELLSAEMEKISVTQSLLMQIISMEDNLLLEQNDVSFVSFRDSVLEFSRKISDLPHEVQVV